VYSYSRLGSFSQPGTKTQQESKFSREPLILTTGRNKIRDTA